MFELPSEKGGAKWVVESAIELLSRSNVPIGLPCVSGVATSGLK